MQVYSDSGKTFALPAVAHGLNVVAQLKGRLPKGASTVRWHALSSDGHVVSGVYTFGVRVAAPPPMEAYGAQGPTRTEHIVRWLYFLSFALLGALSGCDSRPKVVMPPSNVPPPPRPRVAGGGGDPAQAAPEMEPREKLANPKPADPSPRGAKE